MQYSTCLNAETELTGDSVPTQSLFLAACRKEKRERPPVWFMRQAGRYLPEYQQLRRQHSLLEMFTSAELAARVTLQPLERFPLDAAIIFADILTPLMGMGIDLDFVEGIGPVIHNPVRSPDEVTALKRPIPEESSAYTLEAISMVAGQLSPYGLPVIGFSGAPYTLSWYLIEGASARHQQSKTKRFRAKHFMLTHEAAWHRLQERLVDLVAEYLIAQMRAGASAVQLFDSWAGTLSPDTFEVYVLPYLAELISRVRSAASSHTTAAGPVPIIYFVPAICSAFHHLAKLDIDVLGVDWRVSLSDASSYFASPPVLQGNLDPEILLGPREYIAPAVQRILNEGASLPAHIFNLGHGVLPETPLENIAEALSAVHQFRYCNS